MCKAREITNRCILRSLIREVSLKAGGDEKQWLESYIDKVIEDWRHDLDAAIICFRDLLNQA